MISQERWEVLTDPEKVLCARSALAILPSETHRVVERGCKSKDASDMAHLIQNNAEAIQIILNCKRNDIGLTVAYEIVAGSLISKDCFEIESKSETEAFSQAIIATLTPLRNEVPNEEIPATILVLCGSEVYANGLSQARLKPDKNRMLRTVLHELDLIPLRTKVISLT